VIQFQTKAARMIPTGPAVRVLFAYEGETGFANSSSAAVSRLRNPLAVEGFLAKESEGAWACPDGAVSPARVLAVGLGEWSKCTGESFRRAGGRAARLARAMRAPALSVAWPEKGFSGGSAGDLLQAFAEGLILGDYQFTRYKTREEEMKGGLRKAEFFVPSGSVPFFAKALEAAVTACEGVLAARDLVNGAPSDVTPKVLADTARRIASRNRGVTVRIYGKKELEKMGAGGILGVNRGSAQEPYLIHLKYSPKKRSGKSVALVGKGITFDSGGLSLKPAGSMETMKMDMSGAAAVLGVFHRIGAWAPPVEVHGIIATTENMPGGRAYKPGDVLKALNGKTMEVLNTDAEGRLILADALCFAERQNPDAIVDMATLTGACVIALGALVAGALGNDETLMGKVLAASERAGEPLWELPLVPEYRRDIRSKVADIKNIGGNREAGTVIGGLFLKEFVAHTPWVHLDIAGPAYLERDFPACPHLAPGGTGFMIRSLIGLLKGF